MALSISSYTIKDICNIIEERDKILSERQARIKYYKNALEKKQNDIKALERKKKSIEESDKSVSKQIEQLEFIQKSLNDSQEVNMQTLLNHHTLETFLVKDLNEKDKVEQHIRHELHSIYNEAKSKLNQNPFYQQLLEKQIQLKKMEVERKMLVKNIDLNKKKMSEKIEIKKKLFYNAFVKLAENYLISHRLIELQNLKVQETMAIKKLYGVQEEVKMKQKFGTARERKIKNITFGSQDYRIREKETKSTTNQYKKETVLLNEKLSSMLRNDEFKKETASPKIRILSEQTVVPAFPRSNFAVPEKRKNILDRSLKWQKLMQGGKLYKNCTKSLALNSQQSSQPSQRTQVDQGSQLSQQDLSQQLHIPFQSQAFTCQEQMDPLIEKNAKPKENSHISNNIQEKLPIAEFKTFEHVEKVSQQITPSPSVCQEPNFSGNTIVKNKPSVNSEVVPKSSFAKQETIPKMNFGESSKSVRFNLDPMTQLKDNEGLFGGQSMFGNAFSSFFSRPVIENPEMDDSEVIKMQEQVTGANNSIFSTVSTEPMENSHVGTEIISPLGENESRGPDFSFELGECNAQIGLSAPEMPQFGGGFFSFSSKNMFNPF